MHINPSIIIAMTIVAAAWVIPWKAVALWKVARAESKVWFVALLLLNTIGILEILYIFIFSKRPRT